MLDKVDNLTTVQRVFRKRRILRFLRNLDTYTNNRVRKTKMLKMYNEIYDNSGYNAHMLLSVMKYHIQEELWKHYNMLMGVFNRIEIDSGVPEICTNIILEYIGPPDSVLNNFKIRWYGLFCQRINHWYRYQYPIVTWDQDKIIQWICRCWNRIGWGGYQIRDIWDDSGLKKLGLIDNQK